jgi:hypothetical protein
MTESKAGFRRVGRYGRVELFAGRESMVVDVPDEVRRAFTFSTLSPQSEAANNEMKRAFLAGAAIDRNTIAAIYRRHGYRNRSVASEVFSTIRMGRFTAKNDIPVRIIDDGDRHWLFDARLPEAYFPSKHLPSTVE